jgi:hypothetical protein
MLYNDFIQWVLSVLQYLQSLVCILLFLLLCPFHIGIFQGSTLIPVLSFPVQLPPHYHICPHDFCCYLVSLKFASTLSNIRFSLGLQLHFCKKWLKLSLWSVEDISYCMPKVEFNILLLLALLLHPHSPRCHRITSDFSFFLIPSLFPFCSSDHVLWRPIS